MTIDQLTFDVTDANTIADSHSVGSFTRAGTDGDLISSGDGNSDNIANTFEGLDIRSFLFGYDAIGDNWDRLQQVAGALKVYIDDGDFTVDVDLKGVYVVTTNEDPDNVGIISHTRAASITDVQQVERTTAGAIGDIASASLSNVNALDVNSFLYAIDDVDGNAELLNLDNTSGGLNIHLAGSDIELDVNDTANTAILSAVENLTAAGTAEKVIASNLAARKYLFVYNNDNRKMYIGGSAVDKDTGFPISPKAYLELRAGPSVDVYFDSEFSTHEVRTLELS